MVQTLAYDTFCKSCGTSSCNVPCSCRDTDSLPSWQSSSSLSVLSLFLSSFSFSRSSYQHRQAKTHSCTMGLMGANCCPFFWETFPQAKACGEMFTMWQLLATFREKQPSMVQSILLLFVEPTHSNPRVFSSPALWPMVNFAVRQLLCVSDVVKCNTRVFKNM